MSNNIRVLTTNNLSPDFSLDVLSGKVGMSSSIVTNTLLKDQTAENFVAARADKLKVDINKAFSFATEANTYYLEDAFDEVERKKIMAGYYLSNKDPNVSHSPLLQAFLDKIPDGSFITAYHGSVFQLSKNVGYRPDVYGEDNRNITKRGVTLVINGLQPCLALLDRKNLKINFEGATFIVDKLGQGGLDIGSENGKDSYGHRIYHTGTWITRPYLEVGYKGGKLGLYPPIDGWREEAPWEGNAYAQKGYWRSGFNTADYAHDLSNYDNNAAVTHNISTPEMVNGKPINLKDENHRPFSAGGYRGGYDERDTDYIEKPTLNNFPQDDGTTARTWGYWRGMSIGSVGDAIRISGDYDTVIHYFHVEGFNGDAVMYGRLSTRKGDSVGRGEVQKAMETGCVAEHQTILGGYSNGNYIGVVGVSRGRNIFVHGVNCEGAKCGHPDYSVQHTRDNSMANIDPGYGFHTSRCLPQYMLVVDNNHWGECARKCCDAHTGNHIYIRNNRGLGGYYGVSTVTEEGVSAETILGVSNYELLPYDKDSFKYQDSVIEVTNNNFVVGITAIHANNGSFGMGTRRNFRIYDSTQKAYINYPVWWLRANIRISDNNVYAPTGFTYGYGHSNFTIINNNFTFAMPKGTFFGMKGSVTGVTVVDGGRNYQKGDMITAVDHSGDPLSRGFSARVSSVDNEGKILTIESITIGTNYTTNSTVNVNTENGTGAVLKLNIRDNAIAFSHGALAGRGPCIADTVINNRIKNSPEGNFTYGFNFGYMDGATIWGNRVDTTPYTSLTRGERKNQPYKTENVFRSGIATVPLIYSGYVTNTEFENNIHYNQLTQKVGDMMGHPYNNGKTVNTGTIATKQPTPDGVGTDPDKPAVGATPIRLPEPPSANKALVFDWSKATDDFLPFKGSTTVGIDIAGIHTPAGYLGLVNNMSWPKYLRNFLKFNDSATAGVFGRFKVSGLNERSTIILPIRVHGLGSNYTRTIVCSTQDDIASDGLQAVKISGKNKFTLKGIKTSTRIYVNGLPYVNDTELDYNVFYVITVVGDFKDGYIQFAGSNETGNNMASMSIGEGLAWYPNYTLNAVSIKYWYDVLAVYYSKFSESGFSAGNSFILPTVPEGVDTSSTSDPVTQPPSNNNGGTDGGGNTQPTPPDASNSGDASNNGGDASNNGGDTTPTGPTQTGKVYTFDWSRATTDLVPFTDKDTGISVRGTLFPTDWVSMVENRASPKYVRARLRSSTATTGVYPIFNITPNEERGTFVAPMRLLNTGNTTVRTFLSSFSDGDGGRVAGSMSVTATKIDDYTYTIKANDNGIIYIDGELYNTNTSLSFNKWYVLTVIGRFNKENINLGAPWSGNVMPESDWGEGIKFYQSTIKSASDIKTEAEELLSKYANFSETANTPSQPTEGRNETPSNGSVIYGSFDWSRATIDAVPFTNGDLTVGLTQGGNNPPSDWSGLVSLETTPKFTRARLRGQTTTIGVYTRMNLEPDVTEGTLIVPMRVLTGALGNSNLRIGISVPNLDSSESGVGALIFTKNTAGDKFTLKGHGGSTVYVNGNVYTPGTELEYDKWYVIGFKGPFSGSYINLGAPWSGNLQISADFGEGISFVRRLLSDEEVSAEYQKLSATYPA